MAFWNAAGHVEDSEVDDALIEIGVNRNTKILGVTVVGWTFPHHADPKKMKERYLLSLSACLNRISEENNLQVVVFNQVSDDIETAQQLSTMMTSNIVIDRRERSPDLLRGMISRCEIFIGTRFHSCIFAMMQDVPTFAISYLPKTENILKDLGLASHTSINNVSVDSITEWANSTLKDYDNAALEVRKLVSAYRQNELTLVDAFNRWKANNVSE